MRFACLVGSDEFVRDDGGNDEAEQELGERLSNDVFQNLSLREGASMSKSRQLAVDWIATWGATISESARCRFFLIIDEEVVRQLLRCPAPVTDYPDELKSCSIKVVDV
jgi:hypothetical protein